MLAKFPGVSKELILLKEDPEVIKMVNMSVKHKDYKVRQRRIIKCDRFKDYKVRQSWITNHNRFCITKCDKIF